MSLEVSNAREQRASAGPLHEINPPMRYRSQAIVVSHRGPCHGQSHEDCVQTEYEGVIPKIEQGTAKRNLSFLQSVRVNSQASHVIQN